MEVLCRKCPNQCKDERTAGKVLRYCSIAPEGNRILEVLRKGKHASNKSKKAKTDGFVGNGSKETVWDAPHWFSERNKQGGSLPVVADKRQDGKAAGF